MRKHLKFVALCLLAALLVWWFGRKLDWAGVRAAFARTDWRLVAAAVGVISTSFLIRACRWRAFLEPLAPGVSLRELFAATTVGFGAIFLAGRAGEVVRPAFLPLRDKRVRPAASFVTIAVERIYDMAAIVLMFSANLLFFRAPEGERAATFARARAAGLVMLALAAAGIIALLLFRRHSEAVIRRLDKAFARLPRLLRRAGGVLTHLLEQLAGSLRVLVNARELLVTAGWTALNWTTIALASLLVYRACGLAFGLRETVFVMGWSLVGSLVPTPGGGAGTFHVATAAGLLVLGAVGTSEEAAAVSIVLHLVMFGPAFFIGLYYFLRSDVSLASLRRLASSAADEEKPAHDAPPAAGEKASVKREAPREARASNW